MALKTLVYVRDINNLSDARYAAGMGVELAGFRLDPQDDSALTPDKLKEITGWIAGVKTVGEFGNASPGEAMLLMGDLNLDYLLVPPSWKNDDFFMPGVSLIRLTVIDGKSIDELLAETESAPENTEYFVLESSDDVLTHEKKAIIKALSGQYPVILSFGITKENVSELIALPDLKGISLKGGDEIRPGYKEFDDLADILEMLETD